MAYRLLCLCGLSPQVVTETLAATLLREGTPPIELHILTTETGLRHVEASLLDDGRAFLKRLLDDYGVDAACRYGRDLVHLAHDHQGRPLADITDAAQNAAVADQLNALVRELTSDPQVALHVSMAGGRKTMGFYAAYALSLHGRPQDELSHVLVDPSLERDPEFFYPPPGSADDVVQLATLPFVRMRDGLSAEWQAGRRSFGETVHQVQALLGRRSLRIDLTRRSVCIAGCELHLSETHFLWMFWLARRVLDGLGPAADDEDDVSDLLEAVEVLEGYGPSALREPVEAALTELGNAQRANYLERTRSRLNMRLQTTPELPPDVGQQYGIHRFGRRGHSRYGLKLQPDEIEVIGEP